ncbi:hypothetical protein V493_01771 [Pseudogymnoascus sp. VKM F-4281 (FW-2241)]|nr:hypothetical protein V493_01771 [Pseudogymnoascus sp. VKM F-4281 (FW-2241)]
MSTPPKTALITGATGLLGRAVTTAFNRQSWSVVGTGLTRASPPAILALDLSDPAAVAKTLDDVKPSVVVHCAANRFPDSCDANPDAARALNVAATRSLAELTAQRGILLIYISTDYVFSGAPGEAPYETSATPAPTNLYGLTKLEGEKAMEEAYAAAGGKGRGVVLRVPVLYGKADKHADSAVNCLVDAVTKAQKGKVVMDDWARRFPTNTEDVGRVAADVAALYTSKIEKGEAGELPGILQFSSEDVFTKYEMCEMFAHLMGLGLENMERDRKGNEGNTGVQRPYDCHLSTEALKQLDIEVATQDFKGWWRWELGAVRR